MYTTRGFRRSHDVESVLHSCSKLAGECRACAFQCSRGKHRWLPHYVCWSRTQKPLDKGEALEKGKGRTTTSQNHHLEILLPYLHSTGTKHCRHSLSLTRIVQAFPSSNAFKPIPSRPLPALAQDERLISFIERELIMLVGVLLKLDACAMARPSALPYLQQLYSIIPVRLQPTSCP